MSFPDDGFLSQNLAGLIGSFRSQNSEWFELADRMNRLAQKLALKELEFQSEGGLADSRVLIILLYFRSLSNFQGTVLMAERGMIIEARTLARSCVECAICMAGLKNDPDQWKAFLNDELASKKARAKVLIKNRDWLNPSQLDGLRTFVTTIEKQWNARSRLDYATIAEKAGIEIFYLLYRQLSADAAHPSVDALNRYIVEEEDGSIKTLQCLPVLKPSEISETISLACNFLFLACSIQIDCFPNKNLSGELGTCWEQFKTLAKKVMDSSLNNKP